MFRERTTDRKDWRTPAELFAYCDHMFGPFTIDAAASKSNALCKEYFTKKTNGLKSHWSGTVWCNPPYGRSIPQWTAKAVAEAKNGIRSCLLIPSRTDTKWFHDNCIPHGMIFFLRGRVTFRGAHHPATFPSAIVLFGPDVVPGTATLSVKTIMKLGKELINGKHDEQRTTEEQSI